MSQILFKLMEENPPQSHWSPNFVLHKEIQENSIQGKINI